MSTYNNEFFHGFILSKKSVDLGLGRSVNQETVLFDFISDRRKLVMKNEVFEEVWMSELIVLL